MKSLLIIIFFSLSALHFVGVDTAKAITPHEKISRQLNRYVADALSLDASEIEISDLKAASSSRRLFPGKITHIRPAKPGKILGRVLFAVTMKQARGNPFVQWVLADVAWIQEVVVATQSLKRHHIITRDDVGIQKIRIQNREIPYATYPAALVGLRVMRSLRTGLAIRTDRLEEAPVILRGDRIMLTLRTGGLSISTTGKAKEDGLQGDMIKVINLDSRKTVIAKVIGTGHVRVSTMAKE